MTKRKKILVTGLVLVAMSSVLLSGCTFGKSIGSAGAPTGFFRTGLQAYTNSLSETKETILKNSQGYQAFQKLQGNEIYVAGTEDQVDNSLN